MQVDHFDTRAAKALKAGDYIALTPHPGLRLMVSETRRTWVYRYKMPGTDSMRQVKLGEWPARSFAQAVDDWQRAREARNEGRDPAAEKRAAAAKRLAAKAKATEIITVAYLVDRYLVEHVDRNCSAGHAQETRRLLDRAIEAMGAREAASVTATEAHEMILALGERVPRSAAMTRGALRRTYSHAIKAGRVTSNPFADPTLGDIPRQNKSQTYLNAEQVGVLLDWMGQPGAYSRTVADALELTLRTGLRSGEVCGIETSEISERNGVLWLDVPGRRMKMGKPHAVPLIGRARSIVEDRKIEGARFLFPTRDGKASIQQKNLGVEVYAHSGLGKSSRYAHLRVCPVVLVDDGHEGIAPWGPHSLRRTASTRLSEDLDCPDRYVEAILAHRRKGVEGDYNKATHMASRVEWMGRWNDYLDALTAAARSEKSDSSIDVAPSAALASGLELLAGAGR